MTSVTQRLTLVTVKCAFVSHRQLCCREVQEIGVVLHQIEVVV